MMDLNHLGSVSLGNFQNLRREISNTYIYSANVTARYLGMKSVAGMARMLEK